jgi:hypothetical protein
MKIKQELIKKQFKTLTKYYNTWGPVTFDIEKVDPIDYDMWYSIGFEEIFEPPVPQINVELLLREQISRLLIDNALLKQELAKARGLVNLSSYTQVREPQWTYNDVHWRAQQSQLMREDKQLVESHCGLRVIAKGRIKISEDGNFYGSSIDNIRKTY